MSKPSDSVNGLVLSALAAQNIELATGWEGTNAALQALIDHPSEKAFDAATRLCRGRDRVERLLGVRILRELGGPDLPFADRSVHVLVDLVAHETDAEVLSWGVSALGFQHRKGAVTTLLSLVDHPDAIVRDAVAGALSGAAADGLDELALNGLLQLSRDADAEVRFSAVFELASWFEAGSDDTRIRSALDQASRDSDPRVVRAAVGAIRG